MLLSRRITRLLCKSVALILPVLLVSVPRLVHRLSYPKLYMPPQVDPSLQGLIPIEWVHIPKTGGSFAFTLLTIEGVCPYMPTGFFNNYHGCAHIDNVVDCLWGKLHPPNACNPLALDTNKGRFDHEGIDYLPKGGFDEGKGRFMTFMRQPEQRILSEYYYQKRLAFKYRGGRPIPIEEFKHMEAGWATKMLSRGRPGGIPCDWPQLGYPTPAEVNEAKIRMQTGFSFVGLTEKWGLSICLFNRMFNQKCRPIHFENGNPTKGNASSTYDTAELNSWRDPYDNELYDIAVKMFEANLERYNVSDSSCEPCWREAGFLREFPPP